MLKRFKLSEGGGKKGEKKPKEISKHPNLNIYLVKKAKKWFGKGNKVFLGSSS